ncbi:RING-box protein 2-like [Anneissia japonica]|uniref:RING-box protein 2-like n=1 Tax=Anneissia japonica TaxID=1529436 RepID=UPI0014257B13|nr:RING-box protein 2-like [Anneissia japonica]
MSKDTKIKGLPVKGQRKVQKSNRKNKEMAAADQQQKHDRMFTLKKWNIVAMWSWDVECDTCAICRVQVMGEELKMHWYSTLVKHNHVYFFSVVVWGECNHSFHNCCMSLWVKQNNRCPLCQQEWTVQRIGK